MSFWPFQIDFSSDSVWATKDYPPEAEAGIAPLTIQQLRHIYQQQLDHQRQETQAAQAKIKLLSQHLDDEAAARQVLQVLCTYIWSTIFKFFFHYHFLFVLLPFPNLCQLEFHLVYSSTEHNNTQFMLIYWTVRK